LPNFITIFNGKIKRIASDKIELVSHAAKHSDKTTAKRECKKNEEIR
jgi:hypothetical protein